MRRYNFLFVIFIIFSIRAGLYGISPAGPDNLIVKTILQDTLKDNQIIFNGRVWINQYFKVMEDQFLFSKEFLPGSVTISNRTFENIKIRYDIYNDEIIVPTNHGLLIQLNKELVDSFNVTFQNKSHHFVNVRADSVKGFNGYLNVLYQGETILYVKHKKEIAILAVDRKFDLFYKTHRIYLVKDSLVTQVNSRRELYKLLGDNKAQVKSFVKKNRLVISVKNPDNIVNLIKYYDGLSPQK